MPKRYDPVRNVRKSIEALRRDLTYIREHFPELPRRQIAVDIINPLYVVLELALSLHPSKGYRKALSDCLLSSEAREVFLLGWRDEMNPWGGPTGWDDAINLSGGPTRDE